MNAYDSLGQKRFDSGSVNVSWFPHIAPNSSGKMSIGEMVSDLHDNLDKPVEMPLRVALAKGLELKGLIDRCRAIPDKDRRGVFKKKNIPAFTASCTLWTRDKDVTRLRFAFL